MARRFSQYLTTTLSSSSVASTTLLKLLPSSLCSPFLSHPRNHLSTKARLIEIDLESSDGGEIEVIGLKKLEDAIHGIFVRRLAPDWLPLRPGSSYWVPPKRSSDNIIEIVERLTNPLTEEECLSLSSTRGWPSSSFFFEGSIRHSTPVQVEVQVHDSSNLGKPSVSEDEE
ncbi:hypothetical protein SOVF_040400 [Spinacia oleracea]|uniref:Uncharacterized protein n=1 Tax=Spinacia oleracea TaxID=3562 RepID=A0ABM3RBB6_SPIOL|nr:uncharacterized protein LOC130467904 [Spinacia oleracea]XP_056692898.1 uncharacterized protein LOC130467904 [Spinacia oleracea]KNA21743.1 hypothetical protein SOVF_040400 [Spinacia oleracea]